MFSFKKLTALILLTLISSNLAADVRPPQVHGFVMGLFSKNPSFDYKPMIDEIRNTGANAISLHIIWMQSDTRSINIHPVEGRTVSDTTLIKTIQDAHKEGIAVMLFPIVLLEYRESDEWRGTIKPLSWSKWFLNYNRFILHYAELAEKQNVEFLNIGSELCSTETKKTDWTNLIKSVRLVYSGKITYTVNWDRLDKVRFWDDLDAISINAYYELSSEETPSADSLALEWKPIIKNIKDKFSRYNKKIWITEIGYFSMDKTAMDPWNYTTKRHLNHKAQQRAYEGFVRAWSNEPILEQVYFYNWWDEGGILDTGYTPRGKPALKIISDWFIQ